MGAFLSRDNPPTRPDFKTTVQEKKELPAWASDSYYVTPGDTLVQIAKRFDVPTRNVVTEDKTPPDPYRLRYWERLYIIPRSSSKRPETHKVTAGETLKRIALQHDMSMADIEAANPDVNFEKLNHNQVLHLKPLI